MSSFCILVFVLFICFNITSQAKKYPQIIGQPQYLTLPLGKAQQIVLPFQKVFQIHTQISFNQKYIHFHPTSIKIQKLKKSTLLQNFSQSQESMLQNLRTPFPLQYRQIVKLTNFLIVLMTPNKIIIIQQNQQHFTVINTFLIQQQQVSNSQFIKLYPLNQKQAIGYMKSGEQIFLIDSKGYTKIQNNYIKTLTHLVSFSQNQKSNDDYNQYQFFASQYQNCFKHYKLNKQLKKIQMIKQFTSSQLEIEKCYTTDINLNYFSTAQSIYVLDQSLGVIEILYKKYKNSYQTTSNGVIIQEKNCQALDYIELDCFVLVCQRQSVTFIVQAFIENPSPKERIIKKMEPVFYDCSFQDLEITPDYYMTFQFGSIDIFWSRKFNYLPQLMHDKKDINFINLQIFKVYTQKINNILTIYMYSIRSNMLIKQKISQQPYKLSISSKQSVKKIFDLEVQGKCQQIIEASLSGKIIVHQKQLSKIKSYDQICLFRKTIQLDTSQYYGERNGNLSLSVSIFMICLMIVIALACICFYKYRGLEKSAIQTLSKLKKDNNSANHVKFVL